MKPISLLPAIAIMLFGVGSIHPCKARQQAPMDAITSVKVSGHVGKKIDLCFEHRVKALDIHEMVDVFARQDEKHNKYALRRIKQQHCYFGLYSLGENGYRVPLVPIATMVTNNCSVSFRKVVTVS